MASRLDLQRELIEFLGSDKVYFEPEEDVSLSYPCIIYSNSGVDTQYANNNIYIYHPVYQITYVSEEPNIDEVGLDLEEPVAETSIIQRFLMTFSHSRHVRNYTTEGLYHSVFELVY